MADSNSNMARSELLIVLEYLFKKTDENHKTFTKDIIEYAQEEYGVKMLRSRVTPILEYLMEETTNDPKRFPFVLKEFSTGKNKRYYVDQRYFSDEEIIRLATSIKKDPYTTQGDSNNLVDKLIKAYTNEFNYEKLKTLVNKKGKSTVKFSDNTLKNLKLLDKAKDNRERVEFSLLKDGQYELSPEIRKYNDENSILKAYVYDTIHFNNNPYALMVDFQTGKVMSIPVSKMRIISSISMYDHPEDAPKAERYFRDVNFQDITLYLRKAVLPIEEGTIEKITFQFIYNESDLNTVMESFQAYFNFQMPFRKITKKAPLVFGNQPQSNNFVYTVYFVVNITANSIAFLKWATSYEIASIIEVTGSQEVVQQLMAHYSKAIYKSRRNDHSYDWSKKNNLKTSIKLKNK